VSKLNILKYLFICLVIFIVVTIGVVYFYAFNTLIGYKEYDVDYTIGNYMGFNLDEDAIHFGTVIPGMKTSRNINISSDRDAMINIYVKNLDYFGIEENNFFLNAGESKEVKLFVIPSYGAKEGNYSGKLEIVYKKP
jgi:hypothetical protein